jgi:tetratricopeptide (TPR) repeat protein
MWLLPPEFPLRPLRLAPDRRALPWYATEHEVEQLMELLRRMVPEIKEWVRVPWSALERVGSGSEARDGAALVVTAPSVLDDEEARATIPGIRWPYVFWQPREPSEEDGAWLEREVKRSLLSELRHGLASDGHPLRSVGIEQLPVDDAAAATEHPVELLMIVQDAVTHRLEHAAEGARAEDWAYSVRRAIGEQLAMRLARLEGKRVRGVLELVLTDGKRPRASETRIEACERLQALGLGVRVGNDIALSPLARSAKEPVVRGVLLERLPTEHWPREDDGHRFLRSSSRPSSGSIVLPPTRIAGPMVVHYPKLVLEALAKLEKAAKELSEASDAALATLRAAWLRPLFFNELSLAPTNVAEEAVARNLRLLEQHRFEREEQRALVELVRILVVSGFEEPTVDVDAHLQRVAEMAARFDESRNRAPHWQAIAPAVEVFAATVLVGHCQDHRQLQQLLAYAARKERAAGGPRSREDGLDRAWRGLSAELLRLTGRSALAARTHELANVFHPELYPAGQDRRIWNQARADREAGNETDAHAMLLRLRGKERRRVHRPLQPDVALELGLVELDRGSTARARELFQQARTPRSDPAPSRVTLYAEAYDAVARLAEGAAAARLEPRLEELARLAGERGDPRLSMLVEIIVGDLLLRTDRFDGARRSYSSAQAKALQVGDRLALACVHEKGALLEETLGRKQEALADLLRGSDIDIDTEHHAAAARQLRRAAELADELGLSDRAEELGARAEEQLRAVEGALVSRFSPNARRTVEEAVQSEEPDPDQGRSGSSEPSME